MQLGGDKERSKVFEDLVMNVVGFNQPRLQVYYKSVERKYVFHVWMLFGIRIGQGTVPLTTDESERELSFEMRLWSLYMHEVGRSLVPLMYSSD